MGVGYMLPLWTCHGQFILPFVDSLMMTGKGRLFYHMPHSHGFHLDTVSGA